MKALIGIIVSLLALSGAAAAQHDEAIRARREAPWTAETLALAERLPVQDGGRVKPLSTFAGFTLLRLNGKRSIETPDGEKLTPTAWLLDTLFFPFQAADYRCFRVENDEVIAAMGLRLAGCGENLADIVEGLDVGDGVGTRGPSDGALVHKDCFGNPLRPAFNPACAFGRLASMNRTFERLVETGVDQRGFT